MGVVWTYGGLKLDLRKLHLRPHVREVVKRALALNAAALICSHNHPSGKPETSTADRQITQRLSDALSLVEIRLLDHIVIGGAAEVSFAERGWL